MNYLMKAGSTDVSVHLIFLDTTTGARVTDVTSATTGLALWFHREGSLVSSLGSISDLSAVDDAHSDQGFIHKVNGEYRLDLPDSAVALESGVSTVYYGGYADGMVALGGKIQLLADDWFIPLPELTGDPGATPTRDQAFAMIYTSIRNKVIIDHTNKLQKLHNDAGTVILQSSYENTDTLYTREKMADP